MAIQTKTGKAKVGRKLLTVGRKWEKVNDNIDEEYFKKLNGKISAKCLVDSTYICTFVPAIEVDKELLMFTQIAENFKLLHVTNS